MRSLRHLLLFVPSLALGLVAAPWLLWWRPFPLEPRLGAPALALAGAALAAALLAGAWGLERVSPSFRFAQKRMEQALRRVRLSAPVALALAAATALAEELFFRGALLPLVGVWGQALLFALLHPAGRRGWAYTAYTLAAGLALGATTVWTGSLWPALLAHFAVNLQGLLEVRGRRAARRA